MAQAVRRFDSLRECQRAPPPKHEAPEFRVKLGLLVADFRWFSLAFRVLGLLPNVVHVFFPVGFNRFGLMWMFWFLISKASLSILDSECQQPSRKVVRGTASARRASGGQILP